MNDEARSQPRARDPARGFFCAADSSKVQ